MILLMIELRVAQDLSSLCAEISPWLPMVFGVRLCRNVGYVMVPTVSAHRHLSLS